jgi:hypothetical protein
MELQLTDGFVTLPIEALVANLTFEEIGVIATFKGAFETALHDPEGEREISAELEAKLSDPKLATVLNSLQERGIFNIVSAGKSVTLRFSLDKAKV